MIIALLAVALLQVGQPGVNPCQPPGVVLQIFDRLVDGRQHIGPVERGAVVEFTVGAFNHGPAGYPMADLSVHIDSTHLVARLDRLTVELAEADGSWRRLDRSADIPDYSFIAPVAEFPLPAGSSRTFRVRMHLDPDQPSSVTPGAALVLTGVECTVRTGSEVNVFPAEPVRTPAWWWLPLGVGAGAGIAVLLWTLRRRV